MPNILSFSGFAIALLASFGGSLHCAGMCGPIRLLCANRWAAILYQSGRGLGYATIGVAAGSFGATVPTWILAPLVVLGISLSLVPTSRLRYWTSIRQQIIQLASAHPLFLGFTSALLPCGLLHGWIGVAAVSATPLIGALLLLALWVGTIPALELSSSLFRAPIFRLRMRFPKIVPITLIIAALIPIGFRYSMANAFFKNSPSCHDQIKR